MGNLFKHYIKLIFDENYRIICSVRKYYRLKSNGDNTIKKRIIKSYLEKKYFILLGKNSIAGEKLTFPHPRNIVIGADVIIGNNCVIYHDVTLGQSLGKFPQLGNNVIVYTGAKIIGDVKIGDNVVIGANAVVTKDVPQNAIVGGIPAKVIRMRNDDDELY